MREEIEAAALFITRLVNKNLSQSNSAACSSASSTHSSSSSTSSSSDSPPGFEDQTATTTSVAGNEAGVNGVDQADKVEQFRQCLTKALYERFHDHWFPEQPAKGQAYRCIRLNKWDRHDITLQRACLQCGIDYKDLQLPVELTLWVDPEEVTCRFGENKGSHCLVAKFKDGELKDNNLNIDDINNIEIEIFPQQHQQHLSTTDRITHQQNLHDSLDFSKQQQHNQQNNLNHSNGNIIVNNNSSYHNYIHQHHQQTQHHHQPQQQHHHRSNLAKATMHPSYHTNNGIANPIYYYF